MGYLTAASIEWCLHYLASAYPSICQLITLPEKSQEGRTIRAIKIAARSDVDRCGVLLIGGVHAREIVNPDLLVSFAFKICQAYTGGTGLTFGPKSYSKVQVQLIVEALDLIILPLVNPDGRVYVQSPTGYAYWRKNRNPNPGLPCKGVDLNRNYDFLWSSGIGTSASSCSDTYKGTAAFSEPETRNVRHLLDTYANICCMADVHSYSELILYPWGDDDSQTTTPSMNFQNPIYDGLRGTTGVGYEEYIPQPDLDWFVDTAVRVRDAISAVRGHVYTAQPSVSLYPTSGTSNDYAYARHLVNSAKHKVHAYVFETGDSHFKFQPPYSEALNIIKEVSAGLVEFCLSCLCVVKETARGTAVAAKLSDLRAFRDRDLMATRAGRSYARLLNRHSIELFSLIRKDPKLRDRAAKILKRVHKIVASRSDKKPEVFGPEVINAVEKLMERADAKASPALRESIQLLRRDMQHFVGRSVLEGLESVNSDRAYREDQE